MMGPALRTVGVARNGAAGAAAAPASRAAAPPPPRPRGAAAAAAAGRARAAALAQRLAIAYYCWSFAFFTWCWLATLAACWARPRVVLPAVAAYVWYIASPARGYRPALDGSWPTPVRSWALWRACAAYFPVRLHKTAELDARAPHVFACHPHGILAFGAFLSFGTRALGFDRLFPGLDVRVLTLRINFLAPALREYLLLLGVCSVERAACVRLLRAGRSVAIVVGGGAEALLSEPRSAALVLRRRRGFVRVALQTGAALVPVYAFGETDTYRTARQLPDSGWSRALRSFQRALLRATGFTLPLAHGRGLLSARAGLLPLRAPVDVVVGAPIAVPRFGGDPRGPEAEALVDEYHARYVAALAALYAEHAPRFGAAAPLVLAE